MGRNFPNGQKLPVRVVVQTDDREMVDHHMNQKFKALLMTMVSNHLETKINFVIFRGFS